MGKAPGTMTWETANSENVGGRDEQQDRVDVFADETSGARLLVVADGMGGHAGGSYASEAVRESARHVWSDPSARATLDPPGLLARICEIAHETINRIGADKGLSPRSTCVLLHVEGGGAHWAHVGDTRLYRFRDGALLDKTRDHSVVQMLVDMGRITEDEMADHPDQNRLTQSLGGETPPDPDFGEARVERGDGFLLCSDGLWETISTEEMATALTARSLSSAANDLVQTALVRGGETGDNISVALGRMAEASVAGTGGGAGAGRKRPMIGVVAFLFVALLAAVGVGWWSQQDSPISSVDVPSNTKPAASAKQGKVPPTSRPKPASPQTRSNPPSSKTPKAKSPGETQQPGKAKDGKKRTESNAKPKANDKTKKKSALKKKDKKGDGDPKKTQTKPPTKSAAPPPKKSTDKTAPGTGETAKPPAKPNTGD